MKAARLLALAAVWAHGAAARRSGMLGNPLVKVQQLLMDLRSGIEEDGEAEAKAYEKFVKWCKDSAMDAKFESESTSAEKEKLEAKIDKLNSDIESSGIKIEELVSATSAAETDLAQASEIRKKEAADFAVSEKELLDTVDTLARALGILQRQAQKDAASLLQADVGNMPSVLKSLAAAADAAAFSSADRDKLVGLIQAGRNAEDEDEDDDLRAPAPSATKSRSSGVLDMIEDLKEKSEGQLTALRKTETDARHNFDMLKQSLKSEIAAGKKDMTEEKSAKSSAEEAKAAAEGDFTRTSEELQKVVKQRDLSAKNCMQTAVDYEVTLKARKEELKVLSDAAGILRETTGGGASLLQVSARDPPGAQALALVKRLARAQHSAALTQLASRVAAVTRFGSNPFGKIKGLIEDMIEQLQEEAKEAASEKAYCDEEMGKTKAKQSELSDDTAGLTAKIDQAMARSGELKRQVKEMEGELASLAKAQAEMDRIRQESHADYVQSKADLEQGIGGVRKALGVLRRYYAKKADKGLLLQADFSSAMEHRDALAKHTKSSGGSSIIGILEVVESDLAKTLAKEETEETDAQTEYEKMTHENEITKAKKDQDVNFKTREFKSLDKTVVELSSSKDSTDAELVAVNEYFAKLKDRCIAKPETYEHRQQRRQAEINGLKEALNALENEAALVQRRHRGRRGPARQPLAAR